ncbi:carbohydrate porin [Vibrio lentus]|uniref:carbohydrate porin n=1 Tax=Vibrio lentus TaxID=136468 RepID=UPI002479CA22|nr:carbohydrate porin [Vibrio lentus]WGS59962.1 carbohydrate porin [Vibrio lentus]
MFGLAVNWASPMESTTQGLDLDDQYTTEAYYRAQITPWLQISPSVQVLNHTAIDLTNGFDNINLIQNKTDVVFALKARFEF